MDREQAKAKDEEVRKIKSEFKVKEIVKAEVESKESVNKATEKMADDFEKRIAKQNEQKAIEMAL